VADRLTLLVDAYMVIQGQWVAVGAGSQVDVSSSAIFKPNQVTGVQAGSGVLSGQGHNQPSPSGPFHTKA
jgi:hypothetical protein